MSKKKLKIKLPNKLSKLIEVAMEDLQSCEVDDKYIIHMDLAWHQPIMQSDDIQRCEVCFAGGVMAKTGKAKLLDNLMPSDFNLSSYDKLGALDSLRSGHFTSALSSMGIYPTEAQTLKDNAEEDGALPDYWIAYDENPTKFKEQMTVLAGYLAAEGY